MKKNVKTFLTISILLLVSGAALAGPDAIFDNPVEPEKSPRINLGKMNYDAFCSSCHGETARGTDKGPTFISKIYHPGHHGDQAFFIAPKKGARAHHWPFGDMKPVEGVNDDQLQLILEYVRAVQQSNGLY